MSHQRLATQPGQPRTTLLSLWLAAWLVAPVTLPDSVLAADTPSPRAQRQAPQLSMSEALYRRLEQVHALMGEDRYAEAATELQRLQPGNEFERAMLLQTEGFVALGRDDPDAAETAFVAAAAADVLPNAVQQGLKYSIASLQFQRGDFVATRSTLQRWFEYEAQPQAEAYILMAASLLELGDPAEAIDWVNAALARRAAPPENWLQLKLAALTQLGDHAGAIALLSELIARRPAHLAYWEAQWSSQLQLEQDAQALATMRTAHQLGLLTGGDHLVNLARLMIYLDVPTEAARLLEHELRAGHLQRDRRMLELLLTAYSGAREIDRAVAVLGELAAEAGDGRDALRAASLLASRGQWDEAAVAAERALLLGDLEEPAQAWFLLGLSAAQTGQTDRAVSALRRAREGGGSLRRSADAWLTTLDGRSLLEPSTGG